MAYTTADKIRKLLVGIDDSVMDDTDVEAHIVNSDAEVDSIVGTAYSLPFASTPPLLEKLSGEIAAYLIIRTEFTEDSVNVNDHLDKYEKAIKVCEEVRDGKRKLVNSSGVEFAKDGNILVSNTKDYNTTFDMGKVEDQNVDTRLIDDIATDRDAE